jgi:hypothetical protein
VYGLVPPETLISIAPLLPPKQLTLVVATKEADNAAAGCPITTPVTVAEQLLASLTVTL